MWMKAAEESLWCELLEEAFGEKQLLNPERMERFHGTQDK
jgi:hypothetical protein